MLIIGLKRALGVVDVGQSVGQSRPGVQQRRGRSIGHARITVGCTSHHAFEEAQHATHLRLTVECGNEMHLRCAGICEADSHAICQKHVTQDVGAVHRIPSCLAIPRN